MSTGPKNWNPMSPGKGGPINLSSGRHTSNNVGSNGKRRGGAGSKMGPGIGKGYLITGTGTTLPTGGLFRGANKAKNAKKVSKR